MAAMTKERFETGLTYDQYKEGMSRNRDRVEANEQNVSLDPEAVRARLGAALSVDCPTRHD